MRINNFIFKIFIICTLVCSALFSADFTVSSFNCGGLSDHYDYIRSVCMHKLSQERYNAEPATMAQLEKIQSVALKILFSSNAAEKQAAEQEWSAGKYAEILDYITAHPDDPESINKPWKEKSENIVTTYKERPVIVYDQEVKEILQKHINDLTKGQGILFGPKNHLNEWLDITRRVMAKRIFNYQLKYDIIALQEADYLDASIFPKNYEVRFSKNKHSINGIAWNNKKFELIEIVGKIVGRGFAVKLRDLESGQTVLIASGHLTGCNPFRIVIDNSNGKRSSAKGDKELLKIIERLDNIYADIKVIAIDSNVTATHPRLSLLKEADYTLDYTNYLEPTCTSPWQVLNTRIDWIAVKALDGSVTISNIPVKGVGLNSPQTNISDHKPIASRVSY